MLKNVLIWVFAFALTIAAAVYQKKTGPTYPKKITFTYENLVYESMLIRSNGPEDCKIELPGISNKVIATLYYKRYPTNDEYTIDTMRHEQGKLIGFLPKQAPAGKLIYRIKLSDKNAVFFESEPTIIRFKGSVKPAILIPHILFIFLAMFFSNATGIAALSRSGNLKKLSFITFAFLGLGGMFFGPLVQLQAFGELWAGFPKGMDLTDNKTLIAFIFWLIAMLANRKKENKFWIILASLITLVIFSIPHSMFGSELDYESGTIIQAFIRMPFVF